MRTTHLFTQSLPNATDSGALSSDAAQEASNLNLISHHARAETLPDALTPLATEFKAGIEYVRSAGKSIHYSYSELHAEALRRAALLHHCGANLDDRVILIVLDEVEMMLSFLGLILAGLVPVLVAPRHVVMDGAVDVLANIHASSESRLILASSSLIASIRARLPRAQAHAIEELFAANISADPVSIPNPNPDQPCFIQYTSGSTGIPKAVQVTHKNILSAARICANAAQQPIGKRKDAVVSWLPLYHDLGLVGFFISPLIARVTTTLLSPQLFARRPRIWLEALHASRATITGAPPFAFNLILRRQKSFDLAGLDLSHLRVLLCGAEPIHLERFKSFAKVLAPTGFNPDAFMPCYGLAEATLAVAIRDRSAPLRADRLSAMHLRNGKVVQAHPDEQELTIVSCGKPVEGHSVEIVCEEGTPIGEGEVGEIRVRGPSVTIGSAPSGWLHTGDLGYRRDGELFVCGRLKDVIIIRGANFHPHEFEATVTSLPQTQGRLAAAFPIVEDDDETFAIVLETRLSDKAGNAELVNLASAAVTREHGVTPAAIILVPPGTIHVTTSGKVQRRQMRDLYEAGSFREV